MNVRRRKATGGGFNEDGVIPLINVVFLLLIFFMLAGRIAEAEKVAVDPPTSAAAPEDHAGPTTIAIAADGQVFLDGVPTPPAEAARAAAAAASGREVLIRADRNAPATRTLEVAALVREVRPDGGRLVVRIGR